MATKKGTNKSETLKGTDGDDILLGRGGDDTLIGGNGNDRLDGGDGSDELVGGNGNDLLLPGQGGADAMDGGRGVDTVSYAYLNTTVGVNINLYPTKQGSPVGDAAGDIFLNIERFIGSEASDSFYIARPEIGQRHYVFGGDGDDLIMVFGGVMRGGEGNDILTGDSSKSWVDIYWLDRDQGADTIDNFADNQDKIRISGKAFDIGAVLGSDELFFRSADTNATGTKAQFIFRGDEDQLFFDADGTGSEAAILVADFTFTSPIDNLTVEDFEIV